MKALGFWLAAIVGGMAVFAVASTFLGRTGFTRDVRRETVFFRMITHLVYQGQPLDIDVVVGCGVRVTRYRDGGSSIEGGRFPYRYALAVEGGHAVEVRSLAQGCSGSTSDNGQVKADVLPEVIWYEDAHEMSLGILYATDDAYRNPTARLQFRGVEVRRATRAEFDIWLASAPENLIPRVATKSLQEYADLPIYSDDILAEPRLFNRRYGPSPKCYGVSRLKLNDSVRETIRAYWPAERPMYWIPSIVDRRKIETYLRDTSNREIVLHEGHPFNWHANGSSDRSLSRRNDSGDHGSDEIYPLKVELADHFVTQAIINRPIIYSDVTISAANLGYAYCISGADNNFSSVARNIIGGKPPLVLDKEFKLRINGIVASGTSFSTIDFFAFESDDYIVRAHEYR